MNSNWLADIHRSAFSQGRGWSASEFETLIKSPHCFVVSESHGFALGRVVAEEAELLTIAVEPEAQGRGIGKRCLAKFHAEAANRDAVSAFLEVAADNLSALSLYKSSGWKESGRRAGYYARHNAPAIDALLMTRSLP